MKTKAAVLVEQGRPLKIYELTIPSLEAGQCLVRIRSAGICRTQLNERDGLKGDDPYIPHLLGHEAYGVIEEVGKGVTKVKQGDNVVISWIKSNGMDVGGGKYISKNDKVINSGAAAVFTQYAVISENRLIPLTEDLSPAVAALLGCAIPTGVGVILNTLQLKKGKSVAIFGVGGVGAAAILGAVVAGCDPIIAIDIIDSKLKYAKELGATHTLINNGSSLSSIFEVTDHGVDAAVEATGISSVGEQAFEALNKKGTLAIAGHPAEGSKISIDPFRVIEGRKIVGTWGGDVDPDIEIPRYVQLFKKGVLPIDKLITHTYTLDQINEALDLLAKGEAGRIVITMNE